MATSASNTAFPGLERILSCPTLPSLPTVAMKVLELTSNQNVRLDEIAAVVQNDLGLASKILRTINSSFYGLSSPCPSISRAVALLGLSTVKSLVLSFSLVDMTRSTQVGLDLEEFWRRNIMSATSARKLALLTGLCDPEEAFLAGVIQNVAMLAMDIVVGEPYRQLLAKSGPDHDKLSAAEHEMLGFDHAFVGAKLAQKWRFAAEQIDAIANHHKPHAAASASPLTKIAIVANVISQALLTPHNGPAKTDAEALARSVFGITADDFRMLLHETREDARDLAKQLLRAAPNTPGREELLSRAEEARLVHDINNQRETEQLRQTAQELARLVTTDALTGVGNRALLDRELERHFARITQQGGTLGLVILDADHFKKLNDTFGHQVGDVVLIELARRFRHTVDQCGLVCRYGGEEFAVLLPEASEKSVAEVADQLRRAIAEKPIALNECGGHSQSSVTITVSAGAATFNESTAIVYARPELLTQAADKALYAAKHAGRNCVRLFRPRVTVNTAA